MYHIKKTVLSILMITGLSACNSKISVSEACSSVSVMCKEIVDDSGCKRQRVSVILNEYDIRVKKDKSKIYQQMLALEDLEHCSYKRSLIQYVSAESRFPIERHESQERIDKREAFRKSISDRKRTKSENYRNTMKYSHYYNQEIEDSSLPQHLYWRYSRLNDKKALYTLVDKDKKGSVSGYDMMFFMSLLYSDIDPEKVEPSLLRALEQYPPNRYDTEGPVLEPAKYDPFKDDGGRLHYSIMRHLTQIYFKNKDYDRAYIFSNLLKINEDKSVDDFTIYSRIQGRGAQHLEKLDEITENVHEWLKEGNFDAWVLEQNLESML